jgi:hypothetical protein
MSVVFPEDSVPVTRRRRDGGAAAAASAPSSRETASAVLSLLTADARFVLCRRRRPVMLRRLEDSRVDERALSLLSLEPPSRMELRQELVILAILDLELNW